MAHQPEFGQRLRQIRRQRGISQRDLAGETVTASYISLLESGSREPTLDVVVYLAGQLDVPAADLIGHELYSLAPSGRVEESLLLAETLAFGAADAHDYARAAQTLRIAFSEAHAEGNGLRALEIGIRLQHVVAALNQPDERVELLTELLQLPGATASSDLQAMLRTDLASALRDSGNLTAARIAALAALDQTRRSSLRSGGQHVKVLGVLISVLVELGEVDHAQIYVQEMLEAAQQADSPGLLGRAHWAATNAYAQMGRRDLARHHLAQAHQALATPTMPLREWLRFCRSSAAVLLDVNDDLHEVDVWLLNAETSARMLGMPVEQKRVAALRARYLLAIDRPQDAHSTVTDLIDNHPEGLSPPELIRLRLVQARALAQLGQRETAGKLMRDLAGESEQLGALPLAVEIWRQVDANQKNAKNAA